MHRNLTAIFVSILFCMICVRLISFFISFVFTFQLFLVSLEDLAAGSFVCCACVRMTMKTNESDSKRAAEHINITSVSQPNGYECSGSDENSNHSHQRKFVCCLNIIRFYYFLKFRNKIFLTFTCKCHLVFSLCLYIDKCRVYFF